MGNNASKINIFLIIFDLLLLYDKVTANLKSYL